MPTLASAGFDRITHGSPALGAALLVVGGSLVGFGTRMAGGFAAVGLVLGFSLSRIGLSSWDEVQSMSTFHDLRLFFTSCDSDTRARSVPRVALASPRFVSESRPRDKKAPA